MEFINKEKTGGFFIPDNQITEEEKKELTSAMAEVGYLVKEEKESKKMCLIAQPTRSLPFFWNPTSILFRCSPHKVLYIDGEMNFEDIEKAKEKSAIKAMALSL